MIRFAFALVGAVQPALSHTISEYVPLDSCEAPTLLVTRRHTDFDESLSAHRHFENKSASIEVRYGLM